MRLVIKRVVFSHKSKHFCLGSKPFLNIIDITWTKEKKPSKFSLIHKCPFFSVHLFGGFLKRLIVIFGTMHILKQRLNETNNLFYLAVPFSSKFKSIARIPSFSMY